MRISYWVVLMCRVALAGCGSGPRTQQEGGHHDQKLNYARDYQRDEVRIQLHRVVLVARLVLGQGAHVARV